MIICYISVFFIFLNGVIGTVIFFIAASGLYGIHRSVYMVQLQQHHCNWHRKQWVLSPIPNSLLLTMKTIQMPKKF